MSVVIEAQYPYSYEDSDGSRVSFEEGDRFFLLKKTSEEWWKVSKSGHPKNSFFVPAAYMKEILTEGQHQSSPPKIDSNENNPPEYVNLVKYRDMMDRGVDVPNSNNVTKPTSLTLNDHRNSPRSRPSPRMSSFGDIAEIDYPISPNETIISYDYSKNMFDGSLEIVGRSSPLSPTSPSGNSDNAFLDSNIAEFGQVVHRRCKSNEIDKVGSPEIPVGWLLETDSISHDKVYINSLTKEKWKSSKDSEGQVYYYQVDGDVTAWELPPIEVHHRASRRKSMDDLNEPKRISEISLNNRNSKCRSVMVDFQGMPLVAPKPKLLLNENQSQTNYRRSMSANSFEAMTEMQTSLTILDSQSVAIAEREGYLVRRKVVEAGRIVKKSGWQQLYAVKYGSSLVFYKDHKCAVPRPGHRIGKPDSSFEIRGATLEHVGKDKAKGKKNVFQLTSYGGATVIQLIADTMKSMGSWVTSLQTTIQRLDEEEPLPPPPELPSPVDDVVDSPPLEIPPPVAPPIITTTPAAEQPTSTPTLPKGFRGFSRKLSRRAASPSVNGSSSASSQPTIVEDDKEKARIKSKLRKFITKRPSYIELEKKGIVRDQIFGCPLDKLCHREKGTVPKFVQSFIRSIEEEGLESDGLYRVCGNVSLVQGLRIAVDHEEPFNLKEPPLNDVHVWTGLLKLYFRELPEPLFPFSSFFPFIDAVQLRDRSEKLKQFKDLVAKLPQPNHDTLKCLLSHLKKVISYKKINRMHSQNVSIVFGPTLLRPEHENLNMALYMACQNQVIDFLLNHFEDLF